MILLLSLLVAIVGCLVYALAANPKVNELGRIAFFAGLLVFLLHVDEVVKVLRH
jgi:Na+/phosphate symporter